MKKLIPVLIAALAFSSCQKEPDLSKLDNEFVVYTNHDKSTNFSSFSTYYIPDSVLVIGDNSGKATYWTLKEEPDRANPILTAYKDNMKARGYQLTNKEDAQLGLQVTYIENTSYFVDYQSPNWWWGYPYYWTSSYWGDWGNNWYYPYAVVYNYNVGSLLAEMINLTAPEGSNKSLPVVWTSYASGLLSGSSKFNTILTVHSIEEAFAQSPYLKTAK